MKLKYKLFLLIAMLTLGTLFTYALFVRVAIEKAELETEAVLLNAIAARVGGRLEGFTALIETLARLPATEAYLRARMDPDAGVRLAIEQAELERFFADVTQTRPAVDQLRLLGVADQGREWLRVERYAGRARIVPPAELQDKGHRDYYLEALRLAPGQVYVSAVDLNREQGAIDPRQLQTLRLARAVHGPDGDPLAVVVINLCFTDLFQGTLAGLRRPQALFLLADDGRYLYRSDRPLSLDAPRTEGALIDDFPQTAELFADEEAVSRTYSLPGGRFLMLLRAYLGGSVETALPLVLALIEPRGAVLPLTRALDVTALSSAVGVFLLGLALSALLLRRLLRPLERVRAVAEAVQRGRIDQRVGAQGRDEIAQLGRAFDAMLDALAKRSIELKQHREQYRLFMENNPAAVAVFDRDMRYIVASRRWIQDYGLSGRQLSGLSQYEVFPTIPERWRAIQRRALAGESLNDDDDSFVREDGRREWVRWAIHPWREPDGAVGGIVMFTEVTTARRQAELSLAESELRLRAIFDGTYQFIGLLAPDGTLLEVNRSALEFGGFTREQALGLKFWDAPWWTWSETVVAQLKAAVERAARGEFIRYEVDVQGGDGPMLTIDFNLRPVRDETGQVVLLIPEGRDISDLKRVEQRLRDSEERFRLAMHSAPIGLALVSLDGVFIEVNQALCQIVGYPQEALLKLDFQTITHPEDLPSDLGLVKQLLAGEIDRYRMMKRYLRNDGGVIWVQLDVSLVRDGEQEPVHFIAQVQDITERIVRERREQAYTQALKDKNRELEAFAYVASHDLQEPLRKIQAFGDRLADMAGDGLDERGRDYLARMQSAATRMRRLIDDLLEYSRVATRTRPFESVDLAALISEVCADMEVQIQESGARIEVGPLPAIEADATQMRQLVQNLLGNAIKFRAPERDLRIAVREQEGAASNGDRRQVIIAFADNGIGFDEQYLDKVFQPFQRLHGRHEYPGTGIGLATCRKIVERHGGSLTASSAPGKGATFLIRLPRSQIVEGQT